MSLFVAYMSAPTTSAWCTNCTRGSKPRISGTTGRRSASANGVSRSSPSTFVNRSSVTVTCGLSSAKSRRNASTSSSERSTFVVGGLLRDPAPPERAQPRYENAHGRLPEPDAAARPQHVVDRFLHGLPDALGLVHHAAARVALLVGRDVEVHRREHAQAELRREIADEA